jgi:phospholipase C
MSFEYYTHPLPPGLPASTQPAHGPDGNVYGPGPRVPLWVISPWSRGGWVNSEAFDHTSVLRFLEARFGVMEPNIVAYRRLISGDLTTAFNFAQPNNEPLPTLDGRKTKGEADAERAAQQALPQVTPDPARGLPVQTTGTRPSRALPYVLHVSAHVDAAKRAVELLFVNTGFQGAVFHVYDKQHLDRLPQRYAVEPLKALEDTWTPTVDDNGLYDLWVLGPNGFHRHFQGDLNQIMTANAPNPEIFVGYDVFGGGLHLQLRNAGGGAVKFTVSSNKIYGPLSAVRSSVSAFRQVPLLPGFGPDPIGLDSGSLIPVGLRSGAVPEFGQPGFGLARPPGFVPGPVFGPGPGMSWSITAPAGDPGELYWDLEGSGFWYDFVITSDSDSRFSRRIAGRVETGRHSVSDPGMGLADQF